MIRVLKSQLISFSSDCGSECHQTNQSPSAFVWLCVTQTFARTYVCATSAIVKTINMFTVVSSLLVFSFGLPEVNRIRLNFLCGKQA